MKANQGTAEARYTAWARKVSAEQELERIILAGMDNWAAALYRAITDPHLSGLESADAARPWWDAFLRFGLEPKIAALFRGAYTATVPPALTAAATDDEFERLLNEQLNALTPEEFQRTVDAQFGEQFNATRRSADHSGYRWEQQHIETVHDRLVIWPDGAWEELRPNIEEAMADASDLEEVKAKVARELGIDSETRRLRAEAQEIQKRLDTEPDMPGHVRAELQARKSQLWHQHDNSLGDWEWLARRIARTEVQGAVEGGQHAAAEHAQAVTGLKWYRRWISTPDDRTRMSHRVADGQVVGPGEKFRVGAAELQYPGDPFAMAPAETIQCRCSVLLYSETDLQRELQGPDGSLGAVRPGGIRLGPDDPAAVSAAIDLEQAEQDAWDAENGGITAAGRFDESKHVRAPKGAKGGGRFTRKAGGGFSITELRARERKLAKALEGRPDTQTQFTGDDGRYTPDRAAHHRRIIGRVLADHADVPRQRKAIIAGGLPGAGKSTVLGETTSNALTLNPDDVKEIMAEEGLIPSIEGFSPMEVSTLVHEEASDITAKIADAAYRAGTNVVWDITMASEGSAQRRIDELRAAGYEVRGVFVDIPVELSAERAGARFRRGMDAYARGEGNGGRWVPPHIAHSAKPTGTKYQSKNRETFEKLRDQFDDAEVWDNSGTEPVRT